MCTMCNILICVCILFPKISESIIVLLSSRASYTSIIFNTKYFKNPLIALSNINIIDCKKNVWLL